MCGFAGKYFLNTALYHDADLNAMIQSIVHRGPDSQGRYGDGRVVLGFCRLSIIDTLSGDQPLYSEDQQIILCANGEIYNYLELKNFLQTKGHQFRTGSDCEVIIHLYEEFGPSFIERLNGMFAFCLYDKIKEKMLLGRDRIGIKPLYYAKLPDMVVFASEIKAILQASEVLAVENTDILGEYLCFRSLAGQRTFFSDIYLLPSATQMEITPNGSNLSCYWRPEYRGVSSQFPDEVTAIRNTLKESVSRQLMSDVPLGTQLSGGVDSSWVSYLAALEAPGMKSFSVGFSETGFDETTEAKAVAQIAGLEYHQIISDPYSFADILPKIIWHNDEPLTHANSVEIYNLCRYAKEHVKVLLTGEGADELFGGYPRYLLARIGKSYERLPFILRPAFRQSLNFLARKRGKKPGFFLGMVPRDLVLWNAVFVPPAKVAWLMDRDELNFGLRCELLEQCWREEMDILDNLLLYEMQTYLQPILLRQDKMSMGASIETRVPILDNRMIDLALSITAIKKMKRFRPKYLFKKAAAIDLPNNIINKPKEGFSVPVGKWMAKNGTLNHFIDHLYGQRYKLPEINSKKLGIIIHEHRDGFVDHQDILWPLINYIIWKSIFINDKSIPQ